MQLSCDIIIYLDHHKVSDLLIINVITDRKLDSTKSSHKWFEISIDKHKQLIVSGLWLLYTNYKHIGQLFSRKKLTYQSIWQLAQITITLLLHRHNALHVLFHCSVSSILCTLSYHCCYLIQFGYFLVNFNILSIRTLLKQWSCKFFCAEKKTSMIGSIIVSSPFFT